MPAESLYQPIPIELIRQAKARLALAGETVDQWATREGYSRKTVYDVLSGKRMCIRGVGLQIAIKLGLRPHPDSPPAAQSLPDELAPVVDRTVAADPPAASCGRRPVSQLGEAAR